jgi:hypothetical protein
MGIVQDVIKLERDPLIDFEELVFQGDFLIFDKQLFSVFLKL